MKKNKIYNYVKNNPLMKDQWKDMYGKDMLHSNETVINAILSYFHDRTYSANSVNKQDYLMPIDIPLNQKYWSSVSNFTQIKNFLLNFEYIIITNKQYIKGQQSMTYKINFDILNKKGIIKYEPKTDYLRKVLVKRDEDLKKEMGEDLYNIIRKSLVDVEFCKTSLDKLEKYWRNVLNNDITQERRAKHHLNYIEKARNYKYLSYEEKQQFSLDSRGNRIFHFFSNLPEEIRNCMRYRDENNQLQKFYYYDITNSQFQFLTIAIKEDYKNWDMCDDCINFEKIVMNGTLYNDFKEWLNTTNYLDIKINRKEAKGLAFSYLFGVGNYKIKEGTQSYYDENGDVNTGLAYLFKLFLRENNMGVMNTIIDTAKTMSGNIRNGIAIKAQRMEANAIKEALLKVYYETGECAITIHDNGTTRSKEAIEIFTEVMNKYVNVKRSNIKLLDSSNSKIIKSQDLLFINEGLDFNNINSYVRSIRIAKQKDMEKKKKSLKYTLYDDLDFKIMAFKIQNGQYVSYKDKTSYDEWVKFKEEQRISESKAKELMSSMGFSSSVDNSDPYMDDPFLNDIDTTNYKPKMYDPYQDQSLYNF